MNIAVLERDLTTKKTEIEALLSTQMATAEKENRARTDDERKVVDDKLVEAKTIKVRIDAHKSDQALLTELGAMTAGMSDAPNDNGGRILRPTFGETRAVKSLGAQFIESPAYDWIKTSKGVRGSAWNSPVFESTPSIFQMGATTLDTTSGSGGPLIISDYQAGITPLLFKRLVVADLIASGTTDSNSITYMKETTFTNAAAPTTEGAAKPESTLVFAQVNDLVQKIAHFLPVTEEMLEDVAQIRSYIDARLRLGVQLTEEDQLLNGSGTPPAIRGILNRSGLTAAQARGTDTNADAIFKQITTIATTVFVDPDGIVMNPANWQTVQLAKDANGQYYGMGPFAAAQTRTLWGLRVVTTPTIVANTALVGDFGGSAQVFRKGGIRVEASNSHQDYFVKNLVAIRAEERLALAVYRPAAFGTVTGLN